MYIYMYMCIKLDFVHSVLLYMNKINRVKDDYLKTKTCPDMNSTTQTRKHTCCKQTFHHVLYMNCAEINMPINEQI